MVRREDYIILHFHHDIHHKTYLDGLNKAEIKLVEARNKNDYEFIKYWENELAFNGSGHILHSIYWTTMISLGRGYQPGLKTLNHINERSSTSTIGNFTHQLSLKYLHPNHTLWGKPHPFY